MAILKRSLLSILKIIMHLGNEKMVALQRWPSHKGVRLESFTLEHLEKVRRLGFGAMSDIVRGVYFY